MEDIKITNSNLTGIGTENSRVMPRKEVDQKYSVLNENAVLGKCVQ